MTRSEMRAQYTPENEADLAEIVKDFAGRKKPIKIVGGGSKLTLGYPVDGAELSTRKLSGISLYDPAALTIVVKAGTTLEQVEQTLVEHGQHLPFEPADYRGLLGSSGQATVGGIAACAISGPRRIQAGACRDSMIGVRFVEGQGNIIKSGGRVMKNVTGYDLVKLLAGSYGSLGIITEISFKLLPAPQQTAVVLITGLSNADAVTAMSAAMGSPFDVSGAAHVAKGLDGEPVTMIRIEGFESSVRYRADKLKQLLASYAPADIAIETEAKNTRAGWKWVRDVEIFSNKPGAVWRLYLKPGDSPEVIEHINRKLQTEVLFDWAGGLVWLHIAPDSDNAEQVIRGAVTSCGGQATLIRPDENNCVVDIFHPLPAPLARLSRTLRRQFDPLEILNPGKMGS